MRLSFARRLAIGSVLVWGLNCGSSSGPVAPAQTAPSDGAAFTLFPRTVQFSWSAVPDASAYMLEVEYCQNPVACSTGSESGAWLAWHLDRVSGTSYALDFIGDQPGRWRVWAIGSNGADGEKSPWRVFYFTTQATDADGKHGAAARGRISV